MKVAQMISLGLAAVACGWDLRTRRIPQVLTLGGALAGLAVHLVNWRVERRHGERDGVAGWHRDFFRSVCAGWSWRRATSSCSVRIGAWLGPMNAIWVGLYAGAAGGILAIFVALTSGYLFQAVGNVGVMLAYWRVNGVKPLPEITLEHSRGPRLAYAVPILAGTMVTLWLK